MLFDKRRLKFCGLLALLPAAVVELVVEVALLALLLLLVGDVFEPSGGLFPAVKPGLLFADVSIEGGERPSLRKISSDFSGFFMSGGGFFFSAVVVALPVALLAAVVTSILDSMLDLITSASSLLGSNTKPLDAALAAAIMDARGIGTTLGALAAAVASFFTWDSIETDDEHADEADSVDEVELDLRGFCSIVISAFLF